MKRIFYRDQIGNWLIVAMILFLIFAVVRNQYIASKLSGKKKSTFGYVLKVYHGAVRSPAGVSYYYFVGNERYSNDVTGRYEFMKPGDTLLIEFAISDPSVSQVKDKYYMKKYSHLKDVE